MLQCLTGPWISGLHYHIKSSCNNATDSIKRLHLDWTLISWHLMFLGCHQVNMSANSLEVMVVNNTKKSLSLGAKLPLPRLLAMNIFQRGYFDLFVQLGPDLCHLFPRAPHPSWKKALSKCHAIVSLSQQGDLGKVKV